MRCINCGWNNPDGLQRCQKCNQPLPVLPKVEEVSESSRPVKPVKDDPRFKSTQRDVRATTVDDIKEGMRSTVLNVNPTYDEAPEPEARHGVILEDEVREKPVREETKEKSEEGFKLVPVDGGDSIACVGSPFVVNRSVLPGAAIDPEFQAELSVLDGCLFVEDKSQLCSTYILAKKKMAVERGDVLLMGGRRFIIE